MTIPKIFSVCSKCGKRSSNCKLIQFNKSKNYSIICDACYNQNDNDVVLNIDYYHEPDNQQMKEGSCFNKYKIKTIRCCKFIKNSFNNFKKKLCSCFLSIKNKCKKSCCYKKIQDDEIILYKV